MGDLSHFGKSSLLMTRLRHLSPSMAFRITNSELLEMVVPADPLDRQTGAYLAEYFRSRMPFYCTTHQSPETGDWDFYRPMRDYGQGFDGTQPPR